MTDTPPTSRAALPLCAVTGRIAGDRLGACGDCDPCARADLVHPAVKALMAERDQFADSYAEACGKCDERAALLKEAAEALEPFGVIFDKWMAVEGAVPAEHHVRVRYKSLSRARAAAAKIKETIVN